MTRVLVAALVALSVPAQAELRRWLVDEAAAFAAAELNGTRVVADSLLVLGALDHEVNLALGRTVVDDFGKRVPLTDGEIGVSTGEWLSGTPNVFGRYFVVDLGLDRAITRVRLPAGASALAQPEYFIRGYRLEAATQEAPDLWRPLAEERANFTLNVDTQADSTWLVLDEQDEPTWRLGRYVRLKLISQDRSNWVAIGDIEVFGTGLVAEGTAVGRFEGPGPMNVGRVRWESVVPEDAAVAMQVRGRETDWPVWDEVAAIDLPGALYAGAEPVDALEYRATLRSQAAFSTPQVRRLEVEYDPVLVAQQVEGQVEPDTVARATPVEITYRARVQVEPGDHGVDMLRLEGLPLEIRSVRLDGVALPQTQALDSGFRWYGDADAGATVIELGPEALPWGAAEIEIEATGTFLRDRTAVTLAVGSSDQAERDGYTNWQFGRPSPGATWTVLGAGAPPGLVSDVAVTPRPFSPFADQAAQFGFVVGNVEGQAKISVELFTLNGVRVRRLAETGPARPYAMAWDGRNSDGNVVDPGLYLYEIRVAAGNHAVSRRGALAVAY